jgi:hypothetical protein
MAGMAAAGAAAGTAIMPGIGTAIGGIAGAFMDGMGGGGSGGSSPQNAQSAIYGDLGQDNSGWNVNFSGVQSNGSNKSAPSALDGLGIGGGTGTISPLMIVGLVAVVGLAIWKKSKSSK